MSDQERAVVLLSGGVDSTTVLAMAQQQGLRVYALSFDYGQRHRWELQAAQRVAACSRVGEHRIVRLDLQAIGGSALTDDIPVPKRGDAGPLPDGIPVTYVPARNTIFLSVALAWAEVIECSDIFIGITAVDCSGYPDCHPEFIEAFTRLAIVATKASCEGRRQVRIHAPLIALSKADIIRRGLELGVDFSLTSSCYDPGADGQPCGACDSCTLSRRGFAELGLNDPRQGSAKDSIGSARMRGGRRRDVQTGYAAAWRAE